MASTYFWNATLALSYIQQEQGEEEQGEEEQVHQRTGVSQTAREIEEGGGGGERVTVEKTSSSMSNWHCQPRPTWSMYLVSQVQQDATLGSTL
jgi:hypothetical protein